MRDPEEESRNNLAEKGILIERPTSPSLIFRNLGSRVAPEFIFRVKLRGGKLRVILDSYLA